MQIRVKSSGYSGGETGGQKTPRRIFADHLAGLLRRVTQFLRRPLGQRQPDPAQVLGQLDKTQRDRPRQLQQGNPTSSA